MADNSDILRLILVAGLWLALLAGYFGILFVAYYCMSLPLRRNERARFFLDLVESGLKQDRRAEDTIVSISRSGDATLGADFYWLAKHLEHGLPLADALERAPRLLPPQISAMLRAGLKLGDLGKVLPACRRLSTDAISTTRGAINYMVVVAFTGLPASVAVLTALQVYVLPKFLGLCAGMEIPEPAGIVFLTGHKGALFLIQLFLLFAVWSAAFVYLGVPRLFPWKEAGFSPLAHRIRYLLPWRRKRMQRDFSAMLAILLDAGVPEPEALALAADCTGNDIFRQRAQQAIRELAQGLKLPEAVQVMDDAGEFRWRLTQALRTPGGFFRALAGWNEALDAKAFQQEQATAQVVTTALVAFNGVLVGVIVVSVFGVLISICKRRFIMVKKSPGERGALTTELIVAMGMLMIAMMPLGFAFPQEQRQMRSLYQRAVAMELIDGEMEVLMAGEWRAFKEGTQAYTLQGESARNLPPGKARLTITGRHVRLEWLPEKKASGGKVVREADAK